MGGGNEAGAQHRAEAQKERGGGTPEIVQQRSEVQSAFPQGLQPSSDIQAAGRQRQHRARVVSERPVWRSERPRKTQSLCPVERADQFGSSRGVL
jgi:hypothetical protein